MMMHIILLLEFFYLLYTTNIKRIYHNNKIYENDFEKIAHSVNTCDILTHYCN